jgi:hypothetical protein
MEVLPKAQAWVIAVSRVLVGANRRKAIGAITSASFQGSGRGLNNQEPHFMLLLTPCSNELRQK